MRKDGYIVMNMVEFNEAIPMTVYQIIIHIISILSIISFHKLGKKLVVFNFLDLAYFIWHTDSCSILLLRHLFHFLCWVIFSCANRLHYLCWAHILTTVKRFLEAWECHTLISLLPKSCVTGSSSRSMFVFGESAMLSSTNAATNLHSSQLCISTIFCLPSSHYFYF